MPRRAFGRQEPLLLHHQAPRQRAKRPRSVLGRRVREHRRRTEPRLVEDGARRGSSGTPTSSLHHALGGDVRVRTDLLVQMRSTRRRLPRRFARVAADYGGGTSRASSTFASSRNRQPTMSRGGERSNRSRLCSSVLQPHLGGRRVSHRRFCVFMFLYTMIRRRAPRAPRARRGAHERVGTALPARSNDGRSALHQLARGGGGAARTCTARWPRAERASARAKTALALAASGRAARRFQRADPAAECQRALARQTGGRQTVRQIARRRLRRRFRGSESPPILESRRRAALDEALVGGRREREARRTRARRRTRRRRSRSDVDATGRVSPRLGAVVEEPPRVSSSAPRRNRRAPR